MKNELLDRQQGLVKLSEPTRETMGESETSIDTFTVTEYPIGLVSRRVPTGLKTIQYEEWVTVNGRRMRRFWQVTGSDTYGLPTGGDLDIFIAILAAWQEADFKDRNIPIRSIYHVLKKLDIPITKKSYERFLTSVQTLIGATYYAENGIYDRTGPRWIDKHTFHLFEEVKIPKRYRPSGPAIPFGYIRASDFVWCLAQRGDFKNLNFTFYKSLLTPLSRCLYRCLDQQHYSGNPYSMDLRRFCLKLGLSERAIKRYKKADLKRILTRALSELKKHGFLTEYSYGDGRDGPKLTVSF